MKLVIGFVVVIGAAVSGELGELRGEVVVENGTSQAVRLGDDGQLIYAANERGDRLIDFSYVGYHSGERAIPDVPVRLTLQPRAGDCTAMIQEAIDQLGRSQADANGFRGAILLKAGTYRIEGKLHINRGGIVLRGEGDGPDGTVLVAAGYGESKYKRTLITVGDGRRARPVTETRQAITDDYVPVGARTFTVASTAGYKVGDRILVHRPATAEWISHIGCDRLRSRWGAVTDTRWVKDGPNPGFYYRRSGASGLRRIALRPNESWEEFQERVPLSEDGKKLDFTKQWEPGWYNFYFERRITAIRGRQITIDAPIVQAMSKRFGGGAIFHYQTPGRVREVGIEHLRLMAEFSAPVEGHPYGDPRKTGSVEQHAWHGIKLHCSSENTWVRHVSGKYFGWSLVSASGIGATVTDCVSLGHASQIRGGRRYPFMIDGQRNLVQRCVTIEGRHEFVSQAKTAGPNVFVDCVGRASKSSAGPHHRYSVGTLFDNIKSERSMESRFRGSSGTGHGWAGSQTCFYNCIAPGFHVQAPPGGISWVLGGHDSFDESERVKPASLYYQQVEARLGKAAVLRLTTAEHLAGLGRYEWVDERLAKVRE